VKNNDSGTQESLETEYPAIIIIIISGQNNLTTGRIAVAYGRFNGIQQVAPACTHTFFLGPNRVLNPNGISIGSGAFIYTFIHQTGSKTTKKTSTVIYLYVGLQLL